MFVFSHIFPLLWEFTYPIFWEFYGFLLHPKYLRNPSLWNVCVFPHFSCIMEIQFSHVLGTAWIFVSSAKISEALNFWNVCVFSYIYLTMGIHFFYILGIIWISASPKIFEKLITFEFLFFFHNFPVLWEFTFPIFWELYGFLLHPKYLRNP